MTRTRARFVFGAVAAALLTASSVAWAQDEEKRDDSPIRILPGLLTPPADDFSRTFADERKDVREVSRPLPPSGPATPSLYCGASSPTC